METSKVSVDIAYDSPPIWYDMRGLIILWLTYKSTLRLQIKFFSQMHVNGQHLEVAVGSGSLFRLIYFFSWLKRSLPQKITGLDYAPSMLAGAQKIFATFKKVELQLADATNLHYKNNSFNSINLANAVHCIPDYEKALSEIFRVLMPDGHFNLNVLLPPSGALKETSNKINKWGIQKGILQGPIEEKTLISLMNTIGFRLLKVFRDGNCLYVTATKPSVMLTKQGI